jgi:hypothetical protein
MTAAAARTSKRQAILAIADSLGAASFTRAELEEIRRRLVVELGPERGRSTDDTIAGVLERAGRSVVWSRRADTGGRYEDEFRDVLRFATLEEAEQSIARLDALRRRFEAEGDAAAVERARELARTGRRRAEMIARNRRIAPAKRAEKTEIAGWFALWLEQPGAFFDWLELRKLSPEFQRDLSDEATATAGETVEAPEETTDE